MIVQIGCKMFISMGKLAVPLVMLLVTGMVSSARNINVGLLLPNSMEFNTAALQSSIDVINSTNGAVLNVTKFVIDSGSMLRHSSRCHQLTDGLSHVSFILEPYQVDPMSCVMSEILKKPHITLSHEHRTQCKNVISMRPDPDQLNQALIAMVKEHQPREVAVIIEDGLGETASDIMSHDHLVNKLFFQIIGTVDFSKRETLGTIVEDLRASGITKVLLVVQGDRVEAIMREVQFRGLIRSKYSWYIPFADFSKFKDKSIADGIFGLQLPVDADRLNETICEWNELQIIRRPHQMIIDPLLHDALEAMTNAAEEYKIKCSPANRQKDTRRCKIKRQGDKCSSVVDFMKRVLVQRGITGDVKFTLSGYRNITNINVKEIANGNELMLGLWSTACETFIWNPGTTYAKQKYEGKCKSKKKDDDDNGQLIAFKPRKRRLSIVTYIQQHQFCYHGGRMLQSFRGTRAQEERHNRDRDNRDNNQPFTEEPFMMLYNDTRRRGNDRFYGFLKDLLERLKNDLDFEYVLHVVSDNNYGVRRKDGSWNGMIGELINKKADIAAAPMTITSSRQQVVEFTKPYMDFSMALIMEKPKGKSLDLFAFMRPFMPSVWVSLVAVTSISATLIYLIDKYSLRGYRNLAKEGEQDIKGDEFRLGNCVWFIGSTLLQQGAELTPRSAPGRILGATFWFYALILIATYTANLAAFFATTKIESKINSIEELAGQDELLYGVLSSGTTYNFFRESTIPLYQSMFKTMTRKSSYAKSSTSAVKRVRQGGYAYLTDGPVLQYKHQRKPCNTFLLRNLLMAKGYGLGLPLNSEWTQLLSVRILKNHMTESPITVNGEEIKVVEQFKYLGSMIKENGDSSHEIKSRIAIARNSTIQLTAIWKSADISRELKLKEEGFIESLRLKYWDERSQCIPDGVKKVSKIPTPIDLYNVAGVYIVLTIGAVIAFIFLFLETKAPTWFQGRCFGCFAKEEVFFKGSQRDKAPGNPMLTYMDFPDNGPSYNMNQLNQRKLPKDIPSDSPMSTDSDHFNDMPPTYRHGRSPRLYHHGQDRESTL